MEYLMTYGWAILIVIIVAAALYALGVFNPATFTGRTATGFQTIGAPSDWDMTSSGAITLKLGNSKMASTLTIYSITATQSGVPSIYWTNTSTCNTTATNWLTMGPGQTGVTIPCGVEGFSITNAGAAGSTYSLKMEVLYNAGGLNHTDTGTVTGTVS